MPDLPDSVVETARAMTLAARRDTHPDSSALRSRRDSLLESYGYSARLRADDDGPVLICYPESWLEKGVFQPDQLESTANAVERPLFSDPPADGWDAIQAHNTELAAKVTREFGDTHGANAAAFGTYMANHHKVRVEAATAAAVDHFLSKYYPRNTWPPPAQAAVIESSIEKLFAVAGESYPEPVDTDNR
ncbi:DUF7108 family protein [Halodesulfurarchaeum sp.]|uniref:DUF7108 family protein n=1 Tax=Halodesulfurarchaeum sp. TaxID=1980530 RepID=UPI001BBBF9CD|nr:rnhA operon protein [Halodesulfurarchaeum sp.]